MRRNKILIFGTFDHFHPGHAFVVCEALARGETTVIVARDRNVERIKGRPPRQSENDRRHAVERAFPDVVALLGDPEDFLAPVRKVRPNLILLGYDQRLPPGVAEEDLGCSVERLRSFMPDRFKSSLRGSDGSVVHFLL